MEAPTEVKAAEEPSKSLEGISQPDAAPAAQVDTATQAAKDEIDFKIQFGRAAAGVKRPATSTVGDLKQEIERTLGIPPNMQKLMFKGKTCSLWMSMRLMS